MAEQTKENGKIALITGITGQDGSYLTELLLDKGYEVHGIIRRASTFNTLRIDHLYKDPHINGVKLFLHYGDLTDANSIRKVIFETYPSEIYNLGAQSHVRVSFDMPEYTMNVTGLGTLRVLDVIKDFQARSGKQVKFYQASSSEMFGSATPPRTKKRLFIRAALTVAPKFSLIIQPSITAKLTAFLRLMAFFSTMKARAGERRS